jgi:hypothetical protein
VKGRARIGGGVVAVAALATPAAAETRCAPAGEEIVTDRPSVTNSSIVVPVGSLQGENGVDLTGTSDSHLLDGTNTRLRLGVAPCLELFVDLPSATLRLSGGAPSGVSNLAPAVRWQLGPLPGEIDLSAIAGIGLPTGTTSLVGRGVQPYVQLPWSRDIGGGWSTSGMFSAFFTPAQTSKERSEATLVLGRDVGAHAGVFVEYVGDFPEHAGPRYAINSGGAWRVTPRQQLDFHVAVGLNHAAPSYVFGVGYSFRFDRLF